MKLYHELASWWPLMSPPDEFEEEARLFLQVILKYKEGIRSALELGCGGGNNAFHLKKHFQMTLTDISADMVEVSKNLNPECDHVIGDMREIDLGKTFDLVFIHDAISYMTSRDELQRTFQTAAHHLNRNGLIFIVPDAFKETFEPYTSCGGQSDERRSFRYLEWVRDEDPGDELVEAEYVYLFKDRDTPAMTQHDSAVYGLFSKDTWQTLLEDLGFKVTFEAINHSELEANSYWAVVATNR